MAISQLVQGLISEFAGSNSTLTSFPSTILEATIPGYGVISKIILRLSGFDIGLIVTGCIGVLGLFKGGQYLYALFYAFCLRIFTSEIQTNDNDNLYYEIMGWIAK
jgi:chaperone BCS1